MISKPQRAASKISSFLSSSSDSTEVVNMLNSALDTDHRVTASNWLSVGSILGRRLVLCALVVYVISSGMHKGVARTLYTGGESLSLRKYFVVNNFICICFILFYLTSQLKTCKHGLIQLLFIGYFIFQHVINFG